jgi:hypothetical protein
MWVNPPWSHHSRAIGDGTETTIGDSHIRADPRHVAIEGSWGFTDPIASWCARLISGDAQPDDEPSGSTVGASSGSLGEVVQLGQDLR